MRKRSMAYTVTAADELKSDINVTPLVDVMLVLLVIFMVVTPLLRQRVPVELPLAEHSQQAGDTAQVTLVAASDGTLLLNGRRVADSELEKALGDLYAVRSDKIIFLEADRNLTYSRVVDLMDVCRSVGIERIGVVTKKTRTTRRERSLAAQRLGGPPPPLSG
jgi:biopolymer transport protein TolR